MNQHPIIIQGGMGAGVSDWRLANTVSRLGQLGVVSGTAIDEILLRRLQDGDPGGHMRRGLDAFPFPAMAERLWTDYYIAGGKAKNVSYRTAPAHRKDDPRAAAERCIVGNFVEVFLAREGHDNPVGINYLEKIQIPHLPSIYGAMLAGVDYVLMGAGIPLKIPGVLDLYVNHQAATYPLVVAGSIEGDDTTMHFDPRDYMEGDPGPLKRPKFLAIISSNTLAVTMLRKANGRVDGFVIEGQTAGGHNAPPRGKMQLNEAGEPVYGVRDTIDLEKICELNVPFWLAGGYGTAEAVQSALQSGAAGVQVGTAFAFSRESGLREDYKQSLLQKAIRGEAKVFTDPLASPTGFPFKVALLEGTYSEAKVYEARPRICDLSYLREPYRTPDGTIGYRCASEPVSLYLSKGGHVEDTVGRKCVCNGLVANIGLQQIRAGGKHVELGLITAGDDLENIADFLPAGASSYGAADVLTRLLRCSAMTAPRAVETGVSETHDLLVTVDSWAGI
jgi:nitronate monooxygenase